MLLIGDIHINSRIKDRLLFGLKNYISKNLDQQDIVFLGDYVYHFSYDRSALLSLFQLFLDLYSQGKNIYVLAGNHDWLGNTFVFEEAKRTYQTLMGGVNLGKSIGKIEFITTVKMVNIDGKDVLFLPYFLDLDSVEYIDLDQISDPKYFELIKIIKNLYKSKKRNEQISARINHILLQYLYQYTQCTVIHHYYIEGIQFPGQKAKFYFNDIAISKLFTEYSDLKMISGHLHQGFTYKNYFCTGSVWYTSSLESNQIKKVFKYHNDSIIANMILTNPYFSLEQSQFDDGVVIDENILDQHIQQVIKKDKENFFSDDIWNVDITNDYQLNLKDTSLSIKVDDLNYDKIFEHIDPVLHSQLNDVKLKKSSITGDLSTLDLQGKNFIEGFSDWKALLKEYIKLKYPSEYEKYLDFLKEYKLL